MSRKTKFTSHKQYLFGLLFSRNAKKTRTKKSSKRALFEYLTNSLNNTCECETHFNKCSSS